MSNITHRDILTEVVDAIINTGFGVVRVFNDDSWIEVSEADDAVNAVMNIKTGSVDFAARGRGLLGGFDFDTTGPVEDTFVGWTRTVSDALETVLDKHFPLAD